MKTVIRLLLSTALLLATQSCSMTHALVTPSYPDDDIVQRTSLSAALDRIDGGVKVMLRVPSSQADATEQDTNRNDAYSIIEKELLKQGFTVRDRALLTELLGDNENASYAQIKDRIDTDIIIEISKIEEHVSYTRSYTDVRTKARCTVEPGFGRFKFTGWKFEARVVVVDGGDIGAMMTYYMHHNPSYFVLHPIHTSDETGVMERYTSYRLRLETAAKMFARRVGKFLTKAPN